MFGSSPHRSSRVVASTRAALLASVVATIATAAGATDLPVTRVVLSSAGLAQFTHEGEAAAGGTVTLPVRLDQVDDVLKSLTVFDAAGAVGPISLPGREPLDELFRDLPFDRDALASPTELLNALVGSEVEIAGPVAARGRIFRVEAEPTTSPDGRQTALRHRLSLLTDKGLVQAVFEEVTALSFVDAQARGQIDRALAGLAENRAKDRRTLSIGVAGEGSRKMAVAYVVAAPIWKTSWRLVAPAASAGKARLQGWAILENQTGGDWTNVDLTLVSGNPVALTQPLYTSIYGERTTVPVTTGAAIAPPSDSGRTAIEARARAARAGAARAEVAEEQSFAKAMMAPAPAMRPALAAPPPPMAAPAEAAVAEAAATQLLYRFPKPVTLATGHTLMLPFVDREIGAERVWVYRPSTDARHPLAALRLLNDGPTALPTGILTAFETAKTGAIEHVGDAVLPLVGPGEAKFLSFALDAATDIRREDRGVRRSSLGTIANGVLKTTIRSRHAFAYEIAAPAAEDRVVIVEEARIGGWTPATKEGIEDTPTHHRLRVVAPKGVTTKAELVLERTDLQTVTLGALGPDDVLARLRGLENESPALREAVDRLAAVVADISRQQTQKDRNEEEREKIVADQERLRANLQSVGAGSDLGRRYVDTMRTQENRLGELDRADRATTEAIAARRRDAEKIVETLKL
ncbi:MAG: DUF4139 domain-containing protein [Hyphomicrobiales bacterium]|nr:DUF4139 domain-containing protein [Hyphomicrobiales bacterium]